MSQTPGSRILLSPTAVAGAYLLELDRRPDERGWFARTWSRTAFAEHGLNPHVEQCSTSFNHLRGTLRGLHFQVPPVEEAKLVRCTTGRIYDVVVDLRPASSTLGQWVGAELSPDNGLAMYCPEGCAHGFITLEDDSEVSYVTSAPFSPAHARGVRWDDPAFEISWPIAPRVVSARDASYPDHVIGTGHE